MERTLPINCGNCAHFDGDAFCALPEGNKIVNGYIEDPDAVVCAKHEERENDRHLAQLEAEDKAKAAEGIAYENALSRASGTY